MRNKTKRIFSARGLELTRVQAALFHPGANPEKVPHDVTSCVELTDAGK